MRIGEGGLGIETAELLRETFRFSEARQLPTSRGLGCMEMGTLGIRRGNLVYKLCDRCTEVQTGRNPSLHW
jgi:hypothetical protein